MSDDTGNVEISQEMITAARAFGLDVELRDEGIVFVNNSTPEENDKALAQLAQRSREAAQQILLLTAELENLLAGYDAFDMLANLSVTSLLNDPETFKEYEQESLSVHIEFPAQLYLKHTYSSGDGNPLIPGPILEQVEQLVRKICTLQVFAWQYNDTDASLTETEKAVSNLRRRTLVNELTIRELLYPHHLRLILSDLFDPFNAWFRTNLGFGFADLLTVLDGFRDLMHKRINERRWDAREFVSDLRAGIEQYHTHEELVNESVLPLVKELLSAEGELEENLMGAGVAICFRDLGRVASLTAEDVGDETGLDVDVVEAVLQYFSQEFGSEDPDLDRPQPLHKTRTRPLLHHEGRYLAPNPQLLLPAVQPRLEEALKVASTSGNDDHTWDRYESRRATYLENKSLELLSKILGGAPSHHSLKYQFVVDGKVQEFELDGLIFFDDVVFLMETKAGLFSDPARRGAAKGMIKDLKALVAKAFEQGVRAREFIENTDTPAFVTKSSAAVTIDKSRCRETFIISVTLDTLYTFTTVLTETARLGIFPEGELPWAVSLGELMVIADIVEHPWQFVHYLRRRQAVNTSGLLFTIDELDWFGKYLDDGLHFESFESDNLGRVTVASYTTGMDDWYRFLSGERKTPAPKPAQNLPPLLLEILMRLEGTHRHGYLQSSIALLDAWARDAETLEVALSNVALDDGQDLGDQVRALLNTAHQMSNRSDE